MAAEASEFGLRPEDFTEPECVLWASNQQAFDLYCTYSTQWRTGPVGAIGLDYAVFFHHLDRIGVSGERYDDIIRKLRVIEAAALEHFSK